MELRSGKAPKTASRAAVLKLECAHLCVGVHENFLRCKCMWLALRECIFITSTCHLSKIYLPESLGEGPSKFSSPRLLPVLPPHLQKVSVLELSLTSPLQEKTLQGTRHGLNSTHGYNVTQAITGWHIPCSSYGFQFFPFNHILERPKPVNSWSVFDMCQGSNEWDMTKVKLLSHLIIYKNKCLGLTYIQTHRHTDTQIHTHQKVLDGWTKL